MTLLSPNHNYAADECIAQIPQHHIPTAEEKVRASESFDKGVLVAAHMAALHDAYIMEMATHPVNEVTIKPASPTSSVGGLKPSTLKQLKIGKGHRRRVLHGTLCMKTLCTKGVNGLVAVNVFEDEEGNATPIYMSNAMEGNGGSAQAQRLYPQDSKVAVKEPYLTRLPDGEVVLLVEKTTDLVFLWVPDYVEESETTNGTTNGGTKGNGLHEKNGAEERSVGRDAFAMDKGSEQDGSSTGGDYADVEDKVEEADPVEKAEGNGDLKEDVVRGASASRGLKFEDNMEKMGRGKCEGGEEGEKEAVGLDEEGQTVFTSEDVLAMRNGGQHEVEEADTKEGQDNLEKQEKVAESQENVAEQGQREVGVAELRENIVEQGEGDVEVAELPENRQDIASESGGDNEESEVQVEARTVEQLDDPWETVAEEAQLQDNIAEQGEGEVEVSELRENGEDIAAESGGGNEGGVEVEARRVEQLDDPWETAASLRAKGNTLFARGGFAKAADMYTRAVDKAREDGQKAEEVLSVSNRAEVWLRLARNQKALADAEEAIRLLEEGGVSAEAAGELAKAKALFRKGRALMGLRKYGEAMSVLQEVLVRAPADRQLREAAMKCRDRLRQALKPGKRQRAAANRKKKSSTQM